MNSRYIDIGKSWGAQRIDDIKSQYESENLKASGEFGNSLETVVNLTDTILTIKILAAAHSEYMLKGRTPNKNSSPEKLRAWVGWAGSTILREWVKNKRLSLNPYAVAWKIARHGINVPNTYNKGTLLNTAFTKENLMQLFNELGDGLTAELKSKYIKSWQ